jgi:hypothetical protein
MSLDHKAFLFDWDRFQDELAPLLTQALQTGDGTHLSSFIESNRSHCQSPYDGEALSADWQSEGEFESVQELADIALSKYYDPNASFGLGSDWQALTESLSQEQQTALLGTPLGRAPHLFDPGLQGSYFQTPATVHQSLHCLADQEQTQLVTFCEQLAAAVAQGKGLYVTF